MFADENSTDAEIACRAGTHRRGVEEVRWRSVEAGFESALEGEPKGCRQRVIQGSDEARLTALACSTKPDGYAGWTLRLLSDTFGTLEGEMVCYETIRQTLKKTS